MTGSARAVHDSGDPLERRLRVIMHAADFPALSKLFTETMAASADGDASSQRLANLVLGDYSLTVKVIRTANSIHYNRTGKPIRSATHAMLLLGSRTVRDLATSLILFEHYQRRSPGLKELMLLSMLTATHARELGARIGLPEPEEAHLCGMFRNLGEVLVAAHFPDDYAAILKKLRDPRAQASKPNADTDSVSAMESAAVSVLGFTYEDLGWAVARHWGMPDSVTDSMRSSGTSANRSLVGVVAFSHELTSAIYRDDTTRGAIRVADAVRRHGATLGVESEAVAEVLERAVAETKEVFSNAQVSFDDLRLRRQTANALRALGAGAAETGSADPADGAETTTELRKRLLQEAETALAADHGYGLESVVLVLLEALLRGGRFDRVVFAIANADRTMIEARLALGHEAEKLLHRFRVPTRAAPVSLALEWRRVALRTVERALTGEELKWCASVGAMSFGVAPLTVDGKLVGCLYADCVEARELADGTAAFLETVAGLTSRAIAARRTGSVAPGKSASERAGAVLRVLRGEAAAAVAAECGVAEAEIEEWKRVFLEGAMKGLSS